MSSSARTLTLRKHALAQACALACALAGVAHSQQLTSVAPRASLPTDGKVVAGTASIVLAANQTTVTQSSAKAVIDWRSFSVGSGNSVVFKQPEASSIVLNRVTGNEASSILGNVTANGQVFLVNPNGIYFGVGAVLDTASLLATTMDIRNDDFMAGRYQFKLSDGAAAGASVANAGILRSRDGGYIVLAGENVSNSGKIEARLGTVALAAGGQLTLDLQGDSLMRFTVDRGASRNGLDVSNLGEISAEGGQVWLSAAAARAAAASVVNNSGTIRATGVEERDGEITLTSGGDVFISGNMDASGARGGRVAVQGANIGVAQSAKLSADAGQTGDGGRITLFADQVMLSSGQFSARGGVAGGNGGFVETSGKQAVQIAGTRVDTSAVKGAWGDWLIDPTDITVTHDVLTPATFSSGSLVVPAAASTIVSDADINANLATTSVTISTASAGPSTGKISLNDGVNITGNNGRNLSLIANNAIALGNSSINLGSVTSGGNLILQAGAGVTQGSSGQITAAGLSVTGTGTFNLGTIGVPRTNKLGTVAANVNGSFSLTNGNSDLNAVFTIGTVNGVSGITTSGGDITVYSDTTGGMNVNGAVSTGSASAGTVILQAAEIGTAGFQPLGLNANITGGTVKLYAADNITQSAGSISASNLIVRYAEGSSADSVLLTQDNNVGTLAAVAMGTGSGAANAFTFKNSAAAALTIGTVDGVNGITSRGGDILLTTDSIAVTKAVDALGSPTATVAVTTNSAGRAIRLGDDAAGSLSLTATEIGLIKTGASGVLRVGSASNNGGITVAGNITQSAEQGGWSLQTGGSFTQSNGAALSATRLGVQSGSGALGVTNTANSASQVALKSQGAITYSGAGDTTVEAIDGISGINSGGNPIQIASTGVLALNQGINAGTGSNIRIASVGFSQATGASVTASGLALTGSGAVVLSDTGNKVSTLAANLTDSLTVYSAVPLSIGAVTAGGSTTTGITTGGGTVRLATDQLTISQAITTGGGGVALHPLTATTAFDIGTDTKGTAGRLELSSVELSRINAGSGALTLGDVGIDGAISVLSTLNLGSNAGSLSLANGSGGINVNAAVTANGAVSLASSGTIKDAGGASGLKGSGLVVTAGTGISLTGTNNNFATLLATNSTSGAVSVSDHVNEMSVLSMNQTGGGAIALTNTGKITMSGPVNASGSNMALNAAGAINLQRNIGLGSGVLMLQTSNGGVVQSGGNITASGMELLGTGNFTLARVETLTAGGNTTSTYNDIGTLAANISGNLSYRDKDTLILGAVGATSGISTNGGSLTVETGGPQQTGTTPLPAFGGTLTVVNSLAAGTGSITLTVNNSGASGVQQSGGTITGSGLTVISGGAINLNQSGNHVDNLALKSAGDINYRDSGATSVNGTGIASGNGNVTLTTTGLLSITESINAGNGTVLLQSSAGAQQTTASSGSPGQSTGGITAAKLLVAGSGPFTLTSGANDVDVLAGTFSGDLYYVNSNGVQIGTVNGIDGLTSTNAGIIEVRTVNGAMAVDKPVLSAASGSRGNVSLVVGGNNNLNLNANIRGALVRLNSEGTLSQSGGSVDATSLSLGATNDAVAAVKNFTGAAPPLVEYVLYFSGPTVANYDWLNSSIVKLVLYGKTTDSSFKLAAGRHILATNLLLGGFGSYDLSNAGNDIETLAVLRPWGSATNYNVYYTDANGFKVGSISWDALLTYQVGPVNWSWTGSKLATGVNNNGRWPTYGFGGSGGDVRLIAGGSSAISLEQGIATGGLVSITTNGGLTNEPGAGITADRLKLIGQGSFSLNGPNDVRTLAANITNSSNFIFNNTGNLTIGTIEGQNGVWLSGAGAATIDVRSTDGSLTVSQSVTATADVDSSIKSSAAKVILRSKNDMNITGDIGSFGGATGAGDAALTSLQSDVGSILQTAGTISANDSGGATPAAQAPHRARVLMRAAANTLDAGTAISAGGAITLNTVSAGSTKGQATIDVYAPGGLTANKDITVSSQTAPRINLTTDVVNSDGELQSSRNIKLNKAVSVVQTSATDANKRPATEPAGILISGQNIDLRDKVSITGDYGIALSAQGNLDIYADIVSPGLAGASIATGGSASKVESYNTARVTAKQLGLTGAKDKGIFKLKTNTENLVVMGARAVTIDNSPYTGELLAVLGRVSDATTDPLNGTPVPATNSPVGALSLTTGGKLTILSLNNRSANSYNLEGGVISGRRPLTLIADTISDTPGTIFTDPNTEITLRPLTEGRDIVVSKFPPLTPAANTTYYGAGVAGLLNEFNTDVRLVIGGGDYKGNISVGSRDTSTGGYPQTEQFSLGKMEIAFLTSGRVYNIFSADANYPSTWSDAPLVTSPPWAPAPSVTCLTGMACLAKITTGKIYIQDSLTQVANGNKRNIVFQGQGDGSGANSLPPTSDTPDDSDNGGGGGGGGGGGDNTPTDPTPPPAEVPETGQPTGGGDDGKPQDKVVTVVKTTTNPPVVPVAPTPGPDDNIDDTGDLPPGDLAPDGGSGLPTGGQFSDATPKPPTPDDKTSIDDPKNTPQDPKFTDGDPDPKVPPTLPPGGTPPDDGTPDPDPKLPNTSGLPPTDGDPDPKGPNPTGLPPTGSPDPTDPNPTGLPPGSGPNPTGLPPNGTDPLDPTGTTPNGLPPGGGPNPNGLPGGIDPNDPNSSGLPDSNNPNGNNPNGNGPNGPNGNLLTNTSPTGQDGSGFSGANNVDSNGQNGSNNGPNSNTNGLSGGGQTNGADGSGLSSGNGNTSGNGNGSNTGNSAGLSGDGSGNGGTGSGLSGGSSGEGLGGNGSGLTGGNGDPNGGGLSGDGKGSADSSGLAGGDGRNGANGSGLSGGDGQGGTSSSGLSDGSGDGQGNGIGAGNGQDGTQKDGSGSGNTLNGSDDPNGAKGSGLSGGKGLVGESDGSGSGKDGEAADGRGAQGTGLSGKGGSGAGEGADGGKQTGGGSGSGLQLVGGAQTDSQASSSDQATGGSDGQGNRNNARVDDAFACAADRNQESRTLRVAQGQSMLAVKGSGVRLARGTCGDAGGSKQSNN